MNQRFKILSSLFKLFILMAFLIIKMWSKFVPEHQFFPFWPIESLLFFLNQNFKVMLLHQIYSSSTTLCQSSDSRLLCINSTCESTFSIRCSSLLEFCCKLLVRLYASPICTSWGIISVTWGVLWLGGLSSIHRCLCSIQKILLGVLNH